jgi:hypothetical protein
MQNMAVVLQQKNGIKSMFDEWDVGGTGSITKNEFETGLARHGLKMPTYYRKLLFEEVDADGDGLLSFQEINSYFQRRRSSYAVSQQRSQVKVGSRVSVQGLKHTSRLSNHFGQYYSRYPHLLNRQFGVVVKRAPGSVGGAPVFVVDLECGELVHLSSRNLKVSKPGAVQGNTPAVQSSHKRYHQGDTPEGLWCNREPHRPWTPYQPWAPMYHVPEPDNAYIDPHPGTQIHQIQRPMSARSSASSKSAASTRSSCTARSTSSVRSTSSAGDASVVKQQLSALCIPIGQLLAEIIHIEPHFVSSEAKLLVAAGIHTAKDVLFLSDQTLLGYMYWLKRCCVLC